MEKTARPQLAHLESILQQLSNHEQRTNLQRVEQTSMRTQQRLLKEQLLKAQEELATAQGSKTKLCETIGSLQQATAEREQEIAQLRVELQASRDVQSTMMKKMAAFEDETRKAKRNYAKSIACRTKTAAQLLARLQLTKAYPSVKDMAVTGELAERCEGWIGTEPNKKKRVPAEDQPLLVDEEVRTDTEVGVLPSEAAESANDANSAQENRADSAEIMEADSPAADSSLDNKPTPTPFNCQACESVKSESEQTKESMQAEMDNVRQAMESLRVKHDELVVEMANANKGQMASAQDIQVKDTLINQLKEQLFNAQRKIDEHETTPVAAKCDAPAEIENRLKVLEENLNQMNAYADHLELVIGQCPSCSVKVQAESTQDIENRAG